MFKSTLRNVALVALTLLASQDGLVDARASRRDKTDYPEIEKAFYDWGDRYFWKSYDTVTSDGYELTMFRIEGRTKRKTVAN